ncbi:uncharacterized protein LOC26529303 [Drosophila willistoni]|nr:uncharacterized protein LOC26529303 [Drosophila willistoni]
MKLPISASIYELKTELQSLLNIQTGTLEISPSDATLADSEVAGLGNNKQIKPIVSCYEGNNFVCLIRFSLEAEDIALPLVDNSVSDSNIEVVSLEGSESSVIELSSGASSEKKGQGHEKPIETKREESPSYGCMEEAYGMGDAILYPDHAQLNLK